MKWIVSIVLAVGLMAVAVNARAADYKTPAQLNQAITRCFVAHHHKVTHRTRTAGVAWFPGTYHWIAWSIGDNIRVNDKPVTDPVIIWQSDIGTAAFNHDPCVKKYEAK